MGGWVRKEIPLLLGLLIAMVGIYLGSKAGIDYRDFPLLGARNGVWILAQTMLLFAAFILAVPVFVLIIEIAGYIRNDERLDQLAKDFARLLPVSYSITAILGGLFTLTSYLLFPKFMNYMTGVFKPTYILFAFLILMESTAVFIYWTTWSKLQGGRKKVHIFLGIVLNVLGTLVMFTANSWASFTMSPAGVDMAGKVQSLKEVIFNFTFWPINIHRFIANITFGGFICAAYAAYKFLSAETPQEKAHFDWMGYTGTLVGVATMIFLPFAGYYFGIEIYRIRLNGWIHTPDKADPSNPIDYLVHIKKIALPLYPQFGLEPNIYYIPPVHVPPLISGRCLALRLKALLKITGMVYQI